MPHVFATADIGSNTAHLLVASMNATGLTRLANQSEWLSLGQVVSHEGKIPPDLVTKLVDTLQSFVNLGASFKAEGIYVFATEAMRRASNHEAVIKRIQDGIGITIDLVSPEREAALGLKGALLDTQVSGDFVLAELGGGSMQLALCRNADIVQDVSLPIGTGVLLDRAGIRQPVSARQADRAVALLDRAFVRLPSSPGPAKLVACGGVARGLWRSLHPDGDPVLHRHELEFLAWAVRRLNIPTISARYAVKPKRATTLYPGSLLFSMLLERLGLEEMTVSEFGVREGAVMEMSQGKIAPCQL
ncbi:MAG: hypothetical protein JSS66_00785 [Armatimonadetes bacterium]|nr:hypothetical protein [Armatimonadota bacterium]